MSIVDKKGLAHEKTRGPLRATRHLLVGHVWPRAPRARPRGHEQDHAARKSPRGMLMRCRAEGQKGSQNRFAKQFLTDLCIDI